jgi:alpha-1,6-mannosyltransferase
MRIVHVANFYGPHSGGIKTTLHQLGRGYQRYGHEFIYIVPGSHFVKEETMYGTKISLPSFMLPGSGSYRIISRNSQLKKLIAQLNPDRLEVSDRFTLRSLGRWAKQREIPTVVFSHETLRGLAKRFLPSFFPQKALVDWHNRTLASKFDHVIATTQYAAREFEELGIKNLARIPLGVDLENFNPINRSSELRQELLKENQFLIVHCGRLSPEKEPQRSIEALIEMRNQGIDARLVIIGVGPMWKRMREMASGLPVDLLGYVANPRQVASILACADITFAPGPLETFCLSALESIASGTPVVASSSSAVGEFLALDQDIPAGAVADNYGAAFAQAAISILSTSEARDVARRSAEKLPWDKTIALMMELHKMPNIGDRAPTATTKRKIIAA